VPGPIAGPAGKRPQLPVMAAVLTYAVVAGNLSSRW
jgi:hypothetical protein